MLCLPSTFALSPNARPAEASLLQHLKSSKTVNHACAGMLPQLHLSRAAPWHQQQNAYSQVRASINAMSKSLLTLSESLMH